MDKISDTLHSVSLEGVYVFHFEPHDYVEPVSALPLAIALVLGFILLLGVICKICESVSKLKH